MSRYSILDAVRDLPLPMVRWREEVTPDGVDLDVICHRPGGGHWHVKQVLPQEDLTKFPQPEEILALARQKIVEIFRSSHPERLPLGAQ